MVLASVILLAACNTTQQVTASWVNKQALESGKRYNKVFIAVLSGNLAAKTAVEYDLSAACNSRGIPNVKSLDVFPPNVTGVDTAMLTKKIREMGCDLLFTVAMVNSKTETHYVPGTTTYVPTAGYAYGTGYAYGYGYGAGAGYAGGYYGNPYGYYYNTSVAISSPGYYTTDQTYFLEGNLFDTGNGQLLYSVQSEVYNPGDINAESQTYSNLVMQQMQNDGLLANRPAVKK